jgi:hypothetical protein
MAGVATRARAARTSHFQGPATAAQDRTGCLRNPCRDVGRREQTGRSARRTAIGRQSMIDARVAAQIARTDVFVVEFREMVAATAVDPASPSADARRRGLERIAATLDAVPAISRLGLSPCRQRETNAPFESEIPCGAVGPRAYRRCGSRCRARGVYFGGGLTILPDRERSIQNRRLLYQKKTA